MRVPTRRQPGAGRSSRPGQGPAVTAGADREPRPGPKLDPRAKPRNRKALGAARRPVGLGPELAAGGARPEGADGPRRRGAGPAAGRDERRPAAGNLLHCRQARPTGRWASSRLACGGRPGRAARCRASAGADRARSRPPGELAARSGEVRRGARAPSPAVGAPPPRGSPGRAPRGAADRGVRPRAPSGWRGRAIRVRSEPGGGTTQAALCAGRRYAQRWLLRGQATGGHAKGAGRSRRRTAAGRTMRRCARACVPAPRRAPTQCSRSVRGLPRGRVPGVGERES